MNSYNTPNIIPLATVLNADFESSAMQINELVNFSIQIFFDGTPTGTFTLEASTEPVPQKTLQPGVNGAITFSPTHWTTIANSAFSVTTAGDVMWDYNNRGFTYVRAVYADGSSGVSTSTITYSAFNGVGA